MADAPPPEAKVTLYTYFRSSCSARLRIALHYKAIPFTSIAVNLLKDEQLSAAHRAINPSGSVPALVVEHPANNNKNNTVTVTQSLSALEYLEEISSRFPIAAARPLLPPASEPEERALVRTLASIIACDVQPVTNLRVLKRVGALGVDRVAWSGQFIEDGFHAYEALAAGCAGRFSVGDQLTLADVCLIPAVWAAERAGVSLDQFPTIKRVVEALESEEAVRKAHWRTQPDTPAEFRIASA